MRYPYRYGTGGSSGPAIRAKFRAPGGRRTTGSSRINRRRPRQQRYGNRLPNPSGRRDTHGPVWRHGPLRRQFGRLCDLLRGRIGQGGPRIRRVRVSRPLRFSAAGSLPPFPLLLLLMAVSELTELLSLPFPVLNSEFNLRYEFPTPDDTIVSLSRFGSSNEEGSLVFCDSTGETGRVRRVIAPAWVATCYNAYLGKHVAQQNIGYLLHS